MTAETKNKSNVWVIISIVGLLGFLCVLMCVFMVGIYYFDSGSRFHYVKPSPYPTRIYPTSIPFIMPKGDFQMSWNIYSSEYNSLGGIVTIARNGNRYVEKIVMSDGSSGVYNLSVISEGRVIKLDGHLGDSYNIYPNDYIQIESDGWLSFYDNKGLIYSVPPLK